MDAQPIGVPTPPAGTSAMLSQDEMKANIRELLGKMDAKHQEFNAGKFALDAQSKDKQSEALRQVFDLLQSKGIDPSNIDQVKTFFDKIKSVHPELSQQLEMALQLIMGDNQQSAGIAPDPGAFPAANMNINQNEAPQQTI